MSAARADRLVELLRERELDSLLVTNLVNVRYLSGFTGTNGRRASWARRSAPSSPTSATWSAPSPRCRTSSGCAASRTCSATPPSG